MASRLALFLLVASAVCVGAQAAEAVCPRTAPSQSPATTCTSDTGCSGTQKCCSYGNSKRCVQPVTPDFSRTLYFVNLTEINNENAHLSTFVENRFSSTGTFAELRVERIGTCVKVTLSLQEAEGEKGAAETELTSLTHAPVSIGQFGAGPFQVTSGLDHDLCPEAVPNFHATYHVLNVTGVVETSKVIQKLKSLVGSSGRGWEILSQTVGSCLKIFMEAVVTSAEEEAVMTSLDQAEEAGLTVGDISTPFALTSSSQEATQCYQDFVQTDCGRGQRMCSYVKKCVAEDAFCDGTNDCGDNSDEMNCNFEVYTMKLVTKSQWSDRLLKKNSASYIRLAETVKTTLTNEFLSLTNFSHARVLEIMKVEPDKIGMRATVTFAGSLVASQVKETERRMLDSGIVLGLFPMHFSSITPEMPGACSGKDCGTGLCVVKEDKVACRCVPGQELESCQPIDCRGSEDYCGNSSIPCVKPAYLSGYVCQCPAGLTGPKCDIDVCGQLGSGVCGLGGRCVGDLFNFTLCTCGSLNYGPFCDERGDQRPLPQCQQHRQLMEGFLLHLTGGGENADLLNGYTIGDRMVALGIQNLQVPGCNANDDYEHMCVYNTSDSNFNMCYCTHANGSYNGSDYVGDVCKEPSAFDPEEKDGICPPLPEGVSSFECRHDSDCPGSHKCCRAGVGRACRAPYTVKGGECPAPRTAMTAWMCDSDGECDGHHKCCAEDRGRICRPPVYVTRFQINVTLSANWRQKYSNVHAAGMVQLANTLQGMVSGMEGFQSSELLYVLPDNGKLKAVMEVVASPDVRTTTVTDTVESLLDRALVFDRLQRLVTAASLVTHEFCGSAGCNTGTCINSTRGTHCLCPEEAYGDRCQFLDPCEGGVCQNGGTCESSLLADGASYNFTCHCPRGHRGHTCQVSVCRHFPQGVCNSGTCVGDLRGGVLCSCPLTARGIFCENNGTELPFTECELRHRLNKHLADVLKGSATLGRTGLSSDRLRTILESLSTEWLALVTCQHGGQYSLTSALLSVADGGTERHVCLDPRGEVEGDCKSKVCSAMSTGTGTGTGTLCQNGGTCVGNINLQVCNCSGTGHHGALCQDPGEDDLTECEHQHNLAQLALDALGGQIEVGGQTPEQVKTLVSTLLQDIHRDVLWQPDCTPGGSHAYRGCEYRVADQGIRECYCLDEELFRMTSVPASTTGLPDCPLSGACGEFTSDPCGEHGTCTGDVNAGTLCQCEADYSGMTCDVNEASTLTECQKRSELSNYILSVLHGFKEGHPLLKTSMLQLLTAAGIHKLEVPTCTQDGGLYRFICTYHLHPVGLDECRCTNDDGTYKAAEDGGGSCEDLAKPGECPLAEGEMGIALQGCTTDFNCEDSRKCCAIGSGRQCRDPVYVATFRVNVTIDAPWNSAYSNVMSSDMVGLRSQMEDVFRTVDGFRSVTIVSSRQGSVRVTIDVTASADVTAEDMEDAVSRLRTYQLSVAGTTRRVTQVVFTPHAVCGAMACGTGVCVDTSLGARCVCREGTSGDRCQHIMLACNCSEGQQCLRGTQPDALACSCYPENDATCKLPPWYCQGRAQCSGSEKCVHREECTEGTCEILSSCIGESAQCSGSEKCVHREECTEGTCEILSSCIAASEQHVCDDQPCQHGGLCVVPAQSSFSTPEYQCRCQAGFSGTHCQTNVAICQLVPNNLCSDGCVGDAHVGVLCKCPFGRGGLSCDKPAHSNCERQSAFFSDLRKGWRRELSVPGVTKTQLYNLAMLLAQSVHASTLPLRACTSDGNFARVQCALNLTDNAERCHCVGKEGFPRESNVVAYPGFPACTAPYSPDQLGEALCRTSLGSVCGNGGTCVGNLLNGTLCLCPDSRSGIFCQDAKDQTLTWEPPTSLCELSREVWQMMRRATLANDASLLAPLQGLQAHLFHARTASADVMIRASCRADGRFEAVQCAYNLRTEQATHCYCITARGVVLDSMTAWPVQPQCEGVQSCPARACNLTCEHGLAEDVHGCSICQCRHPCDGQCDHDPNRRCVVELQQDCGRENWEGTCTSGVCRHRHKSGMCPASVSANMTAVETLKSPTAIGGCDVTCLDDADCPHDNKCCGVCGAHCVQSSGESTCTAHRVSAQAELRFVQAVQEGLTTGQIKVDLASRLVRAKLDTIRAATGVWVPQCQNNGFYALTQCYTKVGGVVGRDTAGCFCVDRQGDVIAGTETDDVDDASCNTKPGICPFLQPNSSAAHGCSTDFDCQADLKCCPDGLGSLCVPPLKPKEGEAYSLDEVIANLCQFGRKQCGLKGRCVYHWYTEGRVCDCSPGYYGPFCQSEGTEAAGLTPCRRRKELVDALLSDPTTLNFFLQRARNLGASGVVKLTSPECLDDGQFAVVQCNRDVDSQQSVDCFCVNRHGAPLGGTNVPPDQTPPCARLNPCSLGAPLHHVANGSAVVCGVGQGLCVEGYACQAGRYGDFFCCRDPTSEVDVCKLPPSPGNDCQYFQGRQEVTQQRYYYHEAHKTCKVVNYRGCADVKPNFDSSAICEARCVRKEHVGKCPARTVVAERARCRDVCGRDADCPEDQKCCQTSCGRRCVLALNTGGAVCELGQPLMDSLTQQPLSCLSQADCGAGYHCRNSRCCIKRTERICEQRGLEGQCEGRHTRYRYDPDSRQCLPFTFTGCGANDNNFLTKDACCNTCGPQGRCKEGTCPVPRPVLSVSCELSCLGDGDCPANQICCNTSCGGSACTVPKSPTEASHSCRDELIAHHRQMLHSTSDCFLRFRPRCDSDGNWQKEQCSEKLGVCWCVTPLKGHVVPGTRVRGVAPCQWAVTPVTIEKADKTGSRENSQLGEQCQVCPGGEEVQCCNEDLCLQVCAAHPEAVCRINPCGSCRVQFYNADNQPVDCKQGATTCQIKRQEALQALHQDDIIAMAAFNRRNNVDPELRRPAEGQTQKLFTVSGVPQKCQLMPDSGNCQAYAPLWFYNVTSERCERFVYGLCGGNDNRFPTADDCYLQCKPFASPCHSSKKQCGNNQRCRLNHPSDCFAGPCTLTAQCTASQGDHEAWGVHVADCAEEGGQYEPRQCLDGVCWCVKPQDGAYNKGLTHRPGSLQCAAQGPVKASYAKLECPLGSGSPRVSCVDKCRSARCPGHPGARCVVNLCSCETRFVDKRGSTLTCAADACKGNVFTKAENSCAYSKVCRGRGPGRCEYETRCTGAACSNNPCAVCQSDPCTGRVSFTDTLTRQPVADSSCNKVTHSSCELRQCEVMTHNARANVSDARLVVPRCLEDGSYSPQQTLLDQSLYCVDAYGRPANATASGECEMDPVVKVELQLVYEGNFDDIVPGRQPKIEEAFIGALMDIGIPEVMITNVKVTPGSIVISVDIVRHPDFPEIDLAVIRPLVQFKALSGGLTIRVDGRVLKVKTGGGGVSSSSTSQSQLGGVAEGGLSGGAVAGIVIVFLLLGGAAGGVAFYFLYFKRRLAEGQGNGNPNSLKGGVEGAENNKFSLYTILSFLTQPSALQNDQCVGERWEDHYVKMRP
ncbi:uncharacterized protein LOC143289419 [Babylonia areolata]|uniref:uncharacterized protein LOC143289419 n=1 Tax=Babylonia areolata TaxID=304850 RepID=UPI003FD38F91